MIHCISLACISTPDDNIQKHCFIMSADIDLVLGPLFIKFICIISEYFSCQSILGLHIANHL